MRLAWYVGRIAKTLPVPSLKLPVNSTAISVGTLLGEDRPIAGVFILRKKAKIKSLVLFEDKAKGRDSHTHQDRPEL